MEDGVDAAVPVDAKNASTSDLENCTNRSFPQRPHRSPFSYKEEKGKKEERCKCANLIVSTEGFTPLPCGRFCARSCAKRTQTTRNNTEGAHQNLIKTNSFRHAPFQLLRV